MLTRLVVIIVALTGVLAGLYRLAKIDEEGTMREVRIAIPFSSSVGDLDPANIRTAYDYDIIQNLYGRLLKYNSDSKLVVDFPDSFENDGEQLVFTFGSQAKSSSGRPIGALDAANSLKRLILFGKSSHGDIRRFLCPSHRLESLDDPCPGITVVDQRLILKPVDPSYIPHLVGLLESADYSILPHWILDRRTGKMIDRSHRDTTGPYYIEADQLQENHRVVFGKNPHFSKCNQGGPETVVGINPKSKTSRELFLDGDVDVLPTSIFYPEREYRDLKKDSSVNFHETIPFKLMMIRFSKKAIESTAPAQRLAVGRAAGSAFAKHFGQLGATPTTQFFPPLAFGALKGEEALDAPSESIQTARKLTYGVLPPHYEKIKNELIDDPRIEVILLETHPIMMSPEHQPDLYYVLTDTVWSESLSLLGYNFQNGNFDHPDVDPEAWMTSYMQTEDFEARAAQVRELHSKLLRYSAFVPIERAPFHAFARKPIRFLQNQIHAGVDWCNLRKD